VNQVYQALKQNYDGKLTTNQLLDGLKEGLAQATGDPYTEYFNASEAASFNDELNNSFSGIGAELGQSGGNLEIIAPIDGSPAAKAGLQPKDIISEINGQTTSGLSPDVAADKIRGAAGTKVTLSVIRDSTQTLQFTITRSNIQLPSVTTKILPGNIGYMQISTFADDTTALAQKAANTFKADHVKGIILDLRDNPGGLVDAAVHVSSLWLPENATIMQEKQGNTVVQTYTALGGDVLHGIPTAVLVNSGSASASEITAGALHDNGAATIIGTKTYGKGVVQEVVDLSGGAELKVTVASWYRPNGQSINLKGITPDETVSLPSSGTQDTQEAAAITYLQKQ
jgi:carboxyl-terminal processing protease